MFGVKSLISFQIYPDMGGMKFIQRFCPNVFHSNGANGEFIPFLWAAGLRVTAFIEVSQLKPVANACVCLIESNDTRSLNSLIGFDWSNPILLILLQFQLMLVNCTLSFGAQIPLADGKFTSVSPNSFLVRSQKLPHVCWLNNVKQA